MAEAWIDRHGDVWTLGDDGMLHTPETRPYPSDYVERKWGPLRPVADPAPMTAPDTPSVTLSEAEAVLAILDSHRRSNIVCTCMAWSASYQSEDPEAEHREHLASILAQRAEEAGRAAEEAVVRVRALATKWDETARRVSGRGDWKSAEVREWCADDLRAALDGDRDV